MSLCKSFTHLMSIIDVESKDKNEILSRISLNAFLDFLAGTLLTLIVAGESPLVRVCLITAPLEGMEIA